jgi:hypothetical protein
MEQFSDQNSFVKKVVGSKEDSAKVEDHYAKKFLNQEELAQFSREKTLEEIELINDINHHLKTLIEDYGGIFKSIPSENIHFLDESKLNPETTEEYADPKRVATFDARKQSLVIAPNSQSNKLLLVNAIVHELLHAQSFFSLQINEKGERVRRNGFSIVGKDGLYFTDINESIVVELTKTFEKSFFPQIPGVREAYEAREEYKRAVKNIIEGEALESGEPLPPDLDNRLENVLTLTNHVSGDVRDTLFREHPYKFERMEFQDLISDIYETRKDTFSSKDDVFRIFTKAFFTGEILEVARLIDETYGKGAFRELGETTGYLRDKAD